MPTVSLYMCMITSGIYLYMKCLPISVSLHFSPNQMLTQKFNYITFVQLCFLKGNQSNNQKYSSRSIRDIASLLNCDANEQAVVSKRNSLSHDVLVSTYFQNASITFYCPASLLYIQCLLLDDGLGKQQNCHPISWHDQFIIQGKYSWNC